MTLGILTVAAAVAILSLAVSQRRFEKRVLSLLGKRPLPRATRHLSPHRRCVNEKRRTNDS